MNYSRNIPDWQQYNALQSGASDGAAANMAVAPAGQNVNPNHSFVPSISPPSMGNMNPDCLNKSQNDTNFGSRNYTTHSGGPNGCNMGPSPLTSMVHMSNCIGHYGNSSNMNPTMEEVNNDMDHHRTSMPDEMAHRNNAMSMNGSVNHMVGPGMNVNNNMVPGPRIPPNNSMVSSRQAPYMPGPCKGPCCIPDPNMGYNYSSYPSGAPFRDNMHMHNYNPDDRRHRANVNYRKEAYSNKASSANNQYLMDQRKNYPDYKYRKDATTSRSYHQSSVILPNYGMQNYNVSGDYIKYHHYPPRGGPPVANQPNNPSGMIKFHDPSKHTSYQNNNLMQNVVPNNNVPPMMQNSYYNPQSGPREYPNDSREMMDPSNTRLQSSSGPYAKQQMYRQKFAIQRYTLENQLKEMTRVPGYLSNPKYQECVLRYRELLKLQRTVEFQSCIQETSMNANASANVGPPISPINLQFDHNGILINSNYLPTNFSGTCNQTMNPNPNAAAIQKVPVVADGLQHQQNMQLLEQAGCAAGQQKSPVIIHDPNSVAHPISEQQAEVSAPREVQPNKSSKDFADKPDIDVRQFLANWDESEEEENAIANAIGKGSTPVAVVEFADLNLVTNIADAQKEFGILQNNPAIQGGGPVEINKVVSVVGCISSDGNQVPTIHIVDNLENKIVVEKLDNVLSGISKSNIKNIRELVNKEGPSNNESEKQIASDAPKNPSPKTDQTPCRINESQNVIAKPSVKNSTVIGTVEKENIANVELNNPDDLSLPELTTYECTAVSTSLNTPTHSDNEESLEQVSHLRMSTNPIEIVKNSPIISFTQPADEGNKNKRKPSNDSLNFDLVNSNDVMESFLATQKTGTSSNTNSKEGKGNGNQENQKSDGALECAEDRQELLPREWFSSSPVQYNNKDVNKDEETSPSLSLPTITNDEVDNSPSQTSKSGKKKSKKVIDEPNVCDKIIKQFYKDTSYSNSSNIPLIPGGEDKEEPKIPVLPMEGNCLTKVMKNTSPITNINVLNSDDENTDKEDDIWDEVTNVKNLDNNLSKDLEKSLKKKQNSKYKLKKLLKQRKRLKDMVNLEKIKHLLKSDLQKLDIDEQTSSSTNTDSLKTSEDLSNSSQTSDSNFRPMNFKRRGSKDSAKIVEPSRSKCRTSTDPPSKVSKDKRRRSRSVEPSTNNNDDQSHLFREFKKLKRKRSVCNGADKIELQKMVTEKNSCEKEERGSNHLHTKVCNTQSSEKIVDAEKRLLKYDSNEAKKEFEIQLTNVNFRINDNDLRKSFLALKDESKAAKDNAVDGIKIEINLSCSENKKPSVTKVLNCDDNSADNTTDNSDKKIDNDISSNHERASSKASKENVENLPTKSSQNVELPQIVRNDAAGVRNEFLPVKYSECLTQRITDNPNKKASNEHSILKKQTAKKSDKIEVTDQLKLPKNTLNFKLAKDFYNPQVFNYPNDPLNIYNMQNKNSTLLSSLNIDTLSSNVSTNAKCFDPCSSTRFPDKNLLNCNFDKVDSLPYNINPLTFKNYGSEDTFQNDLDEKVEDSPNGFFNPTFMDDNDKLNTVPIYTTKDGKIKYSPNRKYTYKILLKEKDKLHDSSLIYNNWYSSRLREKKKHKSKHLDGKLHKSSKSLSHKYEQHKQETVINKSPQTNEIELVRDCSVIAIAPSNSFVDTKFVSDTLNAENNDSKSIHEEQNVEERDNDYASKQIVDSNNKLYQDSSILSEENHNVINENRSTVIKQLGIVPQNKGSDIIQNLNNVTLTEESANNKVPCSSIIRTNDADVIENAHICTEESDSDKGVLKQIETTAVSPTGFNINSVIKNDSFKGPYQSVVVFKDGPDKKSLRRHSTSVLQCSESNIKKPRRKSFQSDIIITSVFHDTEHDLRESAVTDVRMDTVSDNVIDSPEEEIEKNTNETVVPGTANIPVIVTDKVPTSTEEDESKQSNIATELAADNNIIIKNVVSLESALIVENKNSLVDKAEVNSAHEKGATLSEKTIQNEIETRSQIYMKNENVIIKKEEEEAEIENKEIEIEHFSMEKYELSVEEEIPPLEKLDFDNNFNLNNSDSESIECPKLESQVDNIPEIAEEKDLKITEESVLGTTWFQNKFAKEADESAKSPHVILKSSTENISNDQHSSISLEKEKLVPKLVIRKSESSPKAFSQSKSPVIKEFDDKSSKSESRPKLPKIPKMIIRNASSRPVTPTIEEISVPHIRASSAESKSSKSRSSRSDDRSKSSSNEVDTKVPKMKIKMENELPKVVIENIDVQTIQKTVPKMKIKKVRSHVPLVMDEEISAQSSRMSRSSEDQKHELESRKRSRDRIPKLKIRKGANISAKVSGKRSRSSSSQSSSKKFRKNSKDREETENFSEYECNTNETPLISDKIPKVIIKRTSTKSEFKCELSKSKRKALEWQPRVTLNRSWILDTMAKEFRHMKVALKLTTSRNTDRMHPQNNIDPNKLKWDKFISDLKKQNKVSNSNSDMISFDISTSTSRRRKNVTCIRNEYSDSEDSEFHLNSRAFDENMNSRDKDDFNESISLRESNNFNILNSKDEYASDDACFDISSIKITDKEDNHSLVLHPVINEMENDDSCTKLSTLSISKKFKFDISKHNETSDIDYEMGGAGFNHSDKSRMSFDNPKSNYVIAVESSDESQTTIEILPASPDISKDEMDILNKKNEKIDFNETVSKQIGLELKISGAELDNLGNTKVKTCNYTIHGNAVPKEKSSEKHSFRSDHTRSKHRRLVSSSSRHKSSESKRHKQSIKADNDGLSCSDLLAKEMLAAKETLKRCFMNCNDNKSTCNIKPKTVEEEKQFSSDGNSVKNMSDQSSHKKEESKKTHVSSREESGTRDKTERRRSKSRSSSFRKYRSSAQISLENQLVNTTISLKQVKNAMKESEKVQMNNAEVTRKLTSSESANRQFVNSIQKAMQVIEGINQKESDKEAKTDEKLAEEDDKRASKEDNMPILEPQTAIEFESSPDRDSSRSPPVITTQDSIDGDPPSPKEELPLKLDLYESESHAKRAKTKHESEMTIAEIVRDLAFHEKATIKHRRYCTLCERWFPSAIRHERHLSGYQHRHTELMQRRTIHTLYTLFTGKPCPKLLPANVTRMDCSPGEPTPLQIVVQDIVINCDDMCCDKKKLEKNDDE